MDRKVIHLSIDDVCDSILDFSHKKELFQYLRTLNSKYGLKITLYLQNWRKFEGVPDGALCDLAKECNWLKFGIHTPKDCDKFETLDFDQGKREWNDFLTEMNRLGLDENSIDSFMRLHTFSGNREAIAGLTLESNGLIKGFWTADDSRKSYYLSDEVCNLLRDGWRIYYDTELDIIFKASDLRLDWFGKKFCTEKSYNKPKMRTPYKELKKMYGDKRHDYNAPIVIFTHEWQIYRNSRLTHRKKWIKDVCRFARDFDYVFGGIKS